MCWIKFQSFPCTEKGANAQQWDVTEKQKQKKMNMVIINQYKNKARHLHIKNTAKIKKNVKKQIGLILGP